MSDNSNFDNMASEAILQVVKNITNVKDGDVLIVRCANYDMLLELANGFYELHPDIRVLMLREQDIDIVDQLSEDQMREGGWLKTATVMEIAQKVKEKENTIDALLFALELGNELSSD